MTQDPGDAAPDREPATSSVDRSIEHLRDDSSFRLVIEKSTDGVLIVAPDGTIRHANKSAGALLGQPPDQLVGAPFGLPSHHEQMAEIDIRTADGQLRIAEMRALHVNWEGHPSYLCSLRDVSERVQSQRELREREERLRLIVDGVRDHAIVRLGPSGIVESWNPGSERLLGYKAREIVGACWDKLLDEDDNGRRGFSGLLESARVGGRAECDCWHRRSDGSRFLGTIVLSPLLDENCLRGFVLVMNDTTERSRLQEELRQRAEELAEADRQKNEFLAILAHELRNPLATVQHAARLLRMGRNNPSVLDGAREMIEGQVRNLGRLIDDLLDVSRLICGKIHLRKEYISLIAPLNRAVEASRPQADAHGMSILCQVPDTPILLEADPTRIEQIFTNLLNNAVKYGKPGGCVQVTVTTDSTDVEVRMTDDGIGIESEMLHRVFELFAQADASLDRSQGGLGIGLTLVKKLTELHDGRVSAHSDGLGLGSEFHVKFPIALNREAPRTIRPSTSSVATRARRVLLVDDNVQALESLALLVQLWGHHVIQAQTGVEALDLVRNESPDVVLLDIGLPLLDGFRVAEALRTFPKREQMTVIAMTGYGRDEDRRRARQAGFDHHLVKPLDLDLLEHLITSSHHRPLSPMEGPGVLRNEGPSLPIKSER